MIRVPYELGWTGDAEHFGRHPHVERGGDGLPRIYDRSFMIARSICDWQTVL
jgi:hypothetical protein